MKQNLRILLLGSGGREAAMAWKILQSPRTEKLFVAPGNAGTADHNVSLDPMDFDAVEQFVEQNSVDMVVVGPEQPLVAGIADRFAGSGVKVIGPGSQGGHARGKQGIRQGIHVQPRDTHGTVHDRHHRHGGRGATISSNRSNRLLQVAKADGLAA